VQLHHIDEDPANNTQGNLAVLCLDCHGDTQTSGGFGRKLDADQVILYRDDWHRIVDARRFREFEEAQDRLPNESARIRHLTSVVEALREHEEFALLAAVYDSAGNMALRDKYVDLALAAGATDEDICFLRGLQDLPDQIPQDVAERRLHRQEEIKDWSQRARTLVSLGRKVEAAHDYVRGVARSMDDGNVFSSAFYLKELVEEGLIEALFEEALDRAANNGDLWWQVRALQELSWSDELERLILGNQKAIKESGFLPILELLYHYLGETERSNQLHMSILTGDVSSLPEELQVSLEEPGEEGELDEQPSSDD
jgi:hypothetical protein